MRQLLEIKETLQHIKPELVRNFHVKSIGLFGSVVRGDFTLNSDIDIIIDFSKPIGVEFVDLANHIEQSLRHKVDLVSRNGIKDHYFRAIEKEIVYV